MATTRPPTDVVTAARGAVGVAAGAVVFGVSGAAVAVAAKDVDADVDTDADAAFEGIEMQILAASIRMSIGVHPATPTAAARDAKARNETAAQRQGHRRCRQAAWDALQHGERDARTLKAVATAALLAAAPEAQLHYAAIRDARSLLAVERVERPTRLLIAATIGDHRRRALDRQRVAGHRRRPCGLSRRRTISVHRPAAP